MYPPRDPEDRIAGSFVIQLCEEVETPHSVKRTRLVLLNNLSQWSSGETGQMETYNRQLYQGQLTEKSSELKCMDVLCTLPWHTILIHKYTNGTSKRYNTMLKYVLYKAVYTATTHLWPTRHNPLILWQSWCRMDLLFWGWWLDLVAGFEGGAPKLILIFGSNARSPSCQSFVLNTSFWKPRYTTEML